MTTAVDRRLPTKADFGSNVVLNIVPPPNNQPPLNVVLLLHGLGDSHGPFTALGQQLQLPYTVILSICGPSPVPALFTGSDRPSFYWGDDIIFDQSRGDIDLDSGFRTAHRLLADEIVGDVLRQKCHFTVRDIMLMGFGQGGMAALEVAASRPAAEYGGVISVGGRVPSSIHDASVNARTPVLLLGGSRSTQLTKSTVAGAKEVFADLEYVKWAKAEDSMPRNRDEMLPLMRFFARRLQTRAGVPEGAVELSR